MRQEFQSTLPVRGATGRFHQLHGGIQIFQSTLPVRGATAIVRIRYAGHEFQSTLPVRGATDVNDAQVKAQAISIHAPREGSD